MHEILHLAHNDMLMPFLVMKAYELFNYVLIPEGIWERKSELKSRL